MGADAFNFRSKWSIGLTSELNWTHRARVAVVSIVMLRSLLCSPLILLHRQQARDHPHKHHAEGGLHGWHHEE